MAGGSLAAGAATTEEPRQRLGAIERALEEERSRSRGLSDAAGRIGTELESLRRDLVGAAARAQNLEDEAGRIANRIADMDAARHAAEETLTRRGRELGLTLSALLRISREPAATLLASPRGTIDVARSTVLLGRLAPELQGRARQLRGELEALATLREEADKQQLALRQAERSLAAERAALDRLIVRKAALRERTLDRQSAAEQRLGDLAREAEDLRALLRGLAEEARRQAEAERRDAEAQQKKAEAERRQSGRIVLKPPSGASGATPEAAPEAAPETAREAAPPAAAPDSRVAALGPPPGPTRHFGDARGALPFPARGTVVENFGAATSTGTTKGITVETRPAATVIAPFDGRIIFAGPFRGYGELLIIAHGDGYHTLLAGMARNFGVVGQWLLAGEPVGHMSDGSETRPRLYIELRREGVPVNPLLWLAASERKVSG